MPVSRSTVELRSPPVRADTPAARGASDSDTGVEFLGAAGAESGLTGAAAKPGHILPGSVPPELINKSCSVEASVATRAMDGIGNAVRETNMAATSRMGSGIEGRILITNGRTGGGQGHKGTYLACGNRGEMLLSCPVTGKNTRNGTGRTRQKDLAWPLPAATTEKLLKLFRRMFDSDGARLTAPLGETIFLVIGTTRNTKDAAGGWVDEKGERRDWDYLEERCVASGSTVDELIASAKHSLRLLRAAPRPGLRELLEDSEGEVARFLRDIEEDRKLLTTDSGAAGSK